VLEVVVDHFGDLVLGKISGPELSWGLY